jgi:flagellar hook assembly protein FlgD
MLGSKVRTLYSGLQDAGFRSVLWNATNDQGDPVSAGVYIYTIETNGYYDSKKMILLK